MNTEWVKGVEAMVKNIRCMMTLIDMFNDLQLSIMFMLVLQCTIWTSCDAAVDFT